MSPDPYRWPEERGWEPAAEGFMLQLARALLTYGESSHRLEEILVAMAERLGIEGTQLFSQPTSVIASFGPVERQRTYMLRLEPGEVNLAKLAAVEEVGHAVADGRLTPAQGNVRIAEIAAQVPPYAPLLETVAFAGFSGATCQLLGGGVREIAAATALGLALRLFTLAAGGRPRIGRVFEPLAAFGVSIGAVALAHLAGPLAVLVTTLAGLLVLLPGLTLTTALTELASRHLASGTARMSGAFITFLALGFGVALGNRTGLELFGALPPLAPPVAPPWPRAAALVVSPLCASITLRAAPRDLAWIVLASVAAATGVRLGTARLGPELGAFVGAFLLGLAAHAYVWWRRRPPATVLVPGLLLLVPGSVGFRAFSSMLERQAVVGVETAFSTILTAVALVSGVLVAGVIVPEPRARG